MRRELDLAPKGGDGPLNNAEIAAQMIRAKGWSATDVALVDTVAEKVKDVRKRLA